MRNRVLALCVPVLVAVAPLGAQFAPTGTSGTISGATYGGSGLGGTTVMSGGVGGVTIGIGAHARFANTPVTNNGAGTYFAEAGGDVLDGAPTLARWNFAFFIGGPASCSYDYRLSYDNNPASGNALAPYPGTGGIFSGAAMCSFIGPTWQDSENIGFGFLGGNPNPSGEYNFAIQQFDHATGAELARVAILVDVSAVPEPASLALFATGLVGLGVVARRKNRA